MRRPYGLEQVVLAALLAVAPVAWRPVLASEPKAPEIHSARAGDRRPDLRGAAADATGHALAGVGVEAEDEAVPERRLHEVNHTTHPPSTHKTTSKATSTNKTNKTNKTKPVSIWEVFANIQGTIMDELNKPDPTSQWINAIFGAAFGMFCVCDGDSGFMFIIIIVVYMFFSIFAMHAAEAAWELPKASVLRRFIGFEAGVLGAAATYYGFEGVKTLLGIAAGWQAAHFSADLMSNKDYGLIKGQLMYEWFLTVFYTLFIMAFVFIFHKEKLLGNVLAVVSPLVGALLFTASLSYAVTELWPCLHQPYLTPESGPWIEFVKNLGWGDFNREVKDVGLFANKWDNPSVNGHQLKLDRVLGQVIIVIIAALGMVVQFHYRKQREAELKKIAEEEQRLRSQRRPSFFLKSSGSEADAGGALRPPLGSQEAKGSKGAKDAKAPSASEDKRCLCFRRSKGKAGSTGSAGSTIGTIVEETNAPRSDLDTPLLGVGAAPPAPP
jgi:hypothetical protein